MIERVLVVQTAFLGDVVLTTPLFRAIKTLRPSPRVTVVTTPAGRALLGGHPFLDEIVVHDKRGADRGPRGVLAAVRAARAARPDAAVAAQRSARTGILVRASGAPLRVGFAGAAGRWAYTERIAWRAEDHAVRRYLALGAPLGVDPPAADPAPVLGVGEEARARVASLLSEHGIGAAEPVLAVAPGSVWGTKRWTPEGFAAVLGWAEREGLRPVLAGSPEEAPLCAEIASQAGGAPPVLAGRIGLADLPALLARARALVVNDSGPGHVASAVGTPVVAVFGPTVPAFGYTPWGERNAIVEQTGLACRPCDSHGPRVCPLGHHRCMREIPADRVIAALAGVLGVSPSGRGTPRAPSPGSPSSA